MKIFSVAISPRPFLVEEYAYCAVDETCKSRKKGFNASMSSFISIGILGMPSALYLTKTSGTGLDLLTRRLIFDKHIHYNCIFRSALLKIEKYAKIVLQDRISVGLERATFLKETRPNPIANRMK